MGYPNRGLNASDRATLDSLPKLHFGAYTADTIIVGSDPNNPTYVTGVVLALSSRPEFTLIDAATGLIRNDSTRSFPMAGTVTYQLSGSGTPATLFLWSEKSTDDGVSFVENALSLRTSEVANNQESSQTKSSAVALWAPGESIRWAMYKTGSGTVTISAPSATVNTGNVVTGLSFYWQLGEP